MAPRNISTPPMISPVLELLNAKINRPNRKMSAALTSIGLVF